MMTSIFAFLLGITLCIPFIIWLYYIGRREGYEEGRLKGAQDAWQEANQCLVEVADTYVKFNGEVINITKMHH